MKTTDNAKIMVFDEETGEIVESKAELETIAE